MKRKQSKSTHYHQIPEEHEVLNESLQLQGTSKRKTNHIIRIALKTSLIVSFMFFFIGLTLIYYSSSRLYRLFQTEIISAVSQWQHPHIKETHGRTNILLLGIGGGDHEAPELTDTIQILSVSPDSSISILSLPRDIWSETLQDRINTAYYYGNLQKRPGGGLAFAKSSIEEVTGLPIHYGAVINFEGFRESIDLIGGIDVEIEKGFTDNKFPIKGKENDQCNGDPLFSCRYTNVSFQQGREHMDGERALTYVRSRHAEGEQGTDYDRGRRQQEVLTAFGHRLQEPQEWFQIDSIEQFQALFNKHVVTDISFADVVGLSKQSIPHYVRDQNIHHISVESQYIHPDNALYGGRYVLIPEKTKQDVSTYLMDQLQGR